jgi:hypothetical protein
MNDYEVILSTGIAERDLAIADATTELLIKFPNVRVWAVDVHDSLDNDDSFGVGLWFETETSIDWPEGETTLLNEWDALETIGHVTVDDYAIPRTEGT